MKEEWEQWLQSPVIITKSGIKVSAPPPTWFWKAHVLVQLKRNPRALEAFTYLVKRGCEDEQLLSLLAVLRQYSGADRWETLSGLPPKKMNSAIAGMLKCAQDIRRINSGRVAQIVMMECPYFAFYKVLPELLEIYADVWKHCGGKIKPRQHVTLNFHKAQLVRYVMKRAGSPCDEKVAELIQAVLGRDYSTDAHKMFRASTGLVRKKTRSSPTSQGVRASRHK